MEDKVKQIKQSFRLMMNGVASQSMREKGVNYHVNWGVPLPELKKMAKEIGEDYDLAIALWKDNVRECKIIATMIMPKERMSRELADVWMEQTTSQEIAEMAAFNLYQHLDFAPEIAYTWIASDNELRQICGYHILARLFMKGQEPNERGINEFIDQAKTALSSTNVGLQHAAHNSLMRFADLGLVYERLVNSALK
jgi:3-methyladenine DNA glycosylase AlkD